MCLCKTNCTLRKIIEKHLWLVIILLVVAFSLPSLVRVYNLRHLYLSSEIRANSVEVIVWLRKNKGWGATDLKLNSIDKKSDKIFYSFTYSRKRIGKIYKTDVVVIYEDGEFEIVNVDTSSRLNSK